MLWSNKNTAQSWPLYRSCWLFTAPPHICSSNTTLALISWLVIPHGWGFENMWISIQIHTLLADLASTGWIKSTLQVIIYQYMNQRDQRILRLAPSEVKPHFRVDSSHKKCIKPKKEQLRVTFVPCFLRMHPVYSSSSSTHTYCTHVLTLDMWKVIPWPCESSNTLIAFILLA